MDALNGVTDPELLGYIISGCAAILLGVGAGLVFGKFRRLFQSMEG